MSDSLTDVAAEVGKTYGMTADQVLTHLAIGDRPHGDARPGECGAADPRDDRYWCRQPAGHTGNHNRYTPEECA